MRGQVGIIKIWNVTNKSYKREYGPHL